MDRGQLVFKRVVAKNMRGLGHTQDETQYNTNLLISMYDKICAALAVSTADSSVVDLYTLYDYTSVILCSEIQNNAFVMTSKNALRLRHAVEGIDEQYLMSLFFDNDKIVYGKLNLAGAMATGPPEHGRTAH